MKIRNILSFCDGMSCGQIALERAGIQFDNYYASEIDKYAIKVTQANYPSTIQLGDVTAWQFWNIDWSKIDILLAGFPCQAWSLAGKQKGLKDPRGKLATVLYDIFEYAKLQNPNLIFLF
jgi:site-specific DNA-cytosine methylase